MISAICKKEIFTVESAVRDTVSEIEELERITVQSTESVTTIEEDVISALDLKDENNQSSNMQMDVGNDVNLLNIDTLLLSDIVMLDKNNHNRKSNHFR